MRVHVVRQGEYLTQIAWRYGIDVDTIWDHEKNKALREKRGNPNILAPGDILFIPESSESPQLPFKPETVNRYEAPAPGVEITVAFVNASGKPIRSQPFVVRGVGKPEEGTVNGSGEAKFKVPLHTRSVFLVLPQAHREYRVEVGGLDPESERSGQIARLIHLGYLSPSLLRSSLRAGENSLRRAISRFQQIHHLKQTGEMDPPTIAELSKVHCS